MNFKTSELQPVKLSDITDASIVFCRISMPVLGLLNPH